MEWYRRPPEGGFDGFCYESEAMVSVECAVGRLVEYRSHIIVIGEVRHVWIGEGVASLIYRNGTYQ